MVDSVKTQLYLAGPPLARVDENMLSAVLAERISCLLVDVSAFVETEAGALERMIGIADAAECPLVAGGDDALALDLAKRFALDGVHLSGGAKQIEWARKQIGADRIVGYAAGVSRHDAMTAAEGGADYVMLGPLSDLDPELLTWWQGVIETPLVVDAGDSLEGVAGIADFALIRDVFTAPDPLVRAQELKAALAA